MKQPLKAIRIEQFSALLGQWGPVAQATATATVSHDGDLPEPAVLAQAYAQWQPPWTLPASAQAVPAPLQAQGTFAEWVVFLTSVIQRGCHDLVGQGAVLAEQTRGTLRLAVPYARPGVAKEALFWALQWTVHWALGSPSSKARGLQTQFEQWLIKHQAKGLSPNAFRFGWAAMQQGIPAEAHGGLLRLGWGRAQQVWDSSFSAQTRVVGTRLARNKALTGQWLAQAGVPVPATAVVQRLKDAIQLAEQWGWPVVTKPAAQDQGTGVTPDIADVEHLAEAFAHAQHHSPEGVIVQKHVTGDDHRLLVVGGKMLMATRRIPAGVVGDGQHTVAALVDQLNADPRRGTGKRSMLIHVALDDEALRCLRDQALSSDAVPEAGRFVRLRRTANISTGGTAQDVTAQVHPDNRALAERACRLLGLDIAGVDFLCPNIARSWREVGGVIIEVNAQPGFRVHWLGDPSRDINAEIIRLAFTHETARIPTTAITGSLGHSQVALMMQHIWNTAGKVAGVCSTQGVWVGQEHIRSDALSGYLGARLLLNDPLVDAAVIELWQKDLVEYGHPCDQYDVAALLSVSNASAPTNNEHAPKQTANLMAEVLARATQAIVLNAEDAWCVAARASAGTQRFLLVGRSAALPAIEAHRAEGGEAVFVQTHAGIAWIVLAAGAAQTPLMPLQDLPAVVPVSPEGQSSEDKLFPVHAYNALFAVALAWAHGIPQETIRAAMTRFGAPSEQGNEQNEHEAKSNSPQS